MVRDSLEQRGWQLVRQLNFPTYWSFDRDGFKAKIYLSRRDLSPYAATLHADKEDVKGGFTFYQLFGDVREIAFHIEGLITLLGAGTGHKLAPSRAASTY